ncbi:hypothetical protein CU254_41960 (plasmid) [Amycolatopsis sp. AA4]|uniref:hypothetical protein n=1 Tax=Actinomycetes TaxID=1760 RepID=UPI0001B56C1F|nr:MULTISPECIES: hypothetical protein [Actinomycetes]ATY17145.1 hypothetical protein CU254_41960 [Amycolatopsis sp. AA4]
MTVLDFVSSTMDERPDPADAAVVPGSVPVTLLGLSGVQNDTDGHGAESPGDSVIRDVRFARRSTTMLQFGVVTHPELEASLGTGLVVLSPGDRETLIANLLGHRESCADKVAEGVRRYLPKGPLTGAEVALARYLDMQEQPQHRAAAIYAAGLVSGQVEPVADSLPHEPLAAALGCPAEFTVELSTDQGWERPFGPLAVRSGAQATIGHRAWRLGIGLVHGLADGLIYDPTAGATFGEKRTPSEPVRMPEQLFADTGTTVSAFARAYRGDVLAAAAAFVRATRARGRVFLANC